MNPIYLPYNEWMAKVKACSAVSTLASFEEKNKPGSSTVPTLPATQVGAILVTGTGTTYGSIDSSEIEGWQLIPEDMFPGQKTTLMQRRADWEKIPELRGDFTGVRVNHNRRPYVMLEQTPVRAFLPELDYACSMEEAVKYEEDGGGGGCWRNELGMPVDMFMFNGYVVSRFYHAKRKEYSLRTYWRIAGKTSHLHIRDLDALWERTMEHGKPWRAVVRKPQPTVQLALF